MIFWIILFLSVVSASLVLALQSLKSAPKINGLYLIRQRAQVNLELVNNLYDSMLFGEVLSIEKLFKGEKSALVIYAPRHIVNKLSIDLLELEDFTDIDQNNVSSLILKAPKIFKAAPALKKDEQIWIQLVLKKVQRQAGKIWLNAKNQSFEIALKKQASKGSPLKSFSATIRATLLVADKQKRQMLALNLSGTPASLEQFQEYKKRSLKDERILTLNEILTLIS